MQNTHSISLNALRVFLIVAQHMSLKQAAAELHVTPGAVSHQIKTLEQTLGVSLFTRRNNAIDLTDAGSRLLQQSMPGFHILNAALGDVARDVDDLCIRVSMSLATRWLIPKLGLFKKQNRKARIRVETVFDIDQQPSPQAHVTIGYYKRHEIPKGAHILYEDICRPYLSPSLLSEIPDPSDLTAIPALQCTDRNWDWEMWLADSGAADAQLNFAGQFDLDDAALRAAATGMGMVLTSAFMITDEIADGRLCPLPNAAEVGLGYYTLHTNDYDTALSRRFVRWLATIVLVE